MPADCGAIDPAAGVVVRLAVDGGRARDEWRTRRPARRNAAWVAKSRRCTPPDDWSTNGLVLLFESAHVSKAERQAFLKVLEHAHQNACSLEAATPAVPASAIATVSRRRARVAGR